MCDLHGTRQQRFLGGTILPAVSVHGLIINRCGPDVFAHDSQHKDAVGVAAGAEHVRPGVLEHEPEGVIPGGRSGKLRDSAKLAIIEAGNGGKR